MATAHLGKGLPFAAGLLLLAATACGGTDTTAPASSSAAAASKPAASVAASSVASVPASASSAPASPVAATSASASAAAKPAAATKITASFDPFLNAFDTGTNSGAFRELFFSPAFDALTWVDATGKLMPDLAASWKTDDGKVWTFTLRTDVKFHDGTPLIAKDVAGTFDFYRNPDNKLPVASIFSDIKSVEAMNDTTVAITSGSVNPVLPQMMSLAYVLKARDLKPTDAQAYKDYWKTGVGTGPFKFVAYSQDTSLDYQAMPDTFVSPRGKAGVQLLSFRNLPDIATRDAALQTGEIQMAYPILADASNGLKSAGLTVGNVPAVAQIHGVLNTTDGAGKDVKVRQALNYAVNKEGIISTVLGGYGQPDGQLIGPAVLGYNPNVKPYPYDTAKAKSLLADAGFANGVDIGEFRYQTSGLFDKAPAEAVAADLTKAGVKTSTVGISGAVWTQQYYVPISGRSPIWPGSTSWDQTFDAGIVYRWWGDEFTDDRGRRWHDAQADQLYGKAKVTVDPQARSALYQQMAQYLHDQAPVIFLWLTDRPTAYDGRKFDWKPGLAADMWTTAQLKLK